MRGNIKMALFTGKATLLFENIMPDKKLVTSIVTVGLSDVFGRNTRRYVVL